MRMQAAVGMGQSVSLSNAASIEQNAKDKTETKDNLGTKIQASAFARADCATQVRVLQELIASSRIVVENDAADDDFAEIVDTVEDDFDSEADFVDDDEIREEDDFSSACASLNGGEPSPLDSFPRTYEIKIVEKASGQWACIPPLNPLRGYRPNGYDTEAHQVLDAVHKQFAFYEAVAKWLLEEGEAVLESPTAFRGNHAPMAQTDFVQTEFCAILRAMMKGTSKKAYTGNIHGYCQNCRLSWGHASLPLDSVFKKI